MHRQYIFYNVFFVYVHVTINSKPDFIIYGHIVCQIRFRIYSQNHASKKLIPQFYNLIRILLNPNKHADGTKMKINLNWDRNKSSKISYEIVKGQIISEQNCGVLKFPNEKQSTVLP